MVIKDINDAGGLLGRPLELFIEDTASNESVAVGNVRKLIQRDKVDVVLGGITSSMRNAIKDTIVSARQDALHLSAALRGQGVHALSVLHRPDAGAAVRHIHSLADQERRQAVRAALANYVWPHTAQRVCAQGDRGQRRRGGLRGILPARPDRVQRHREQDHVQQGERGLQHRHPARRRAVLQAALRGGLPARTAGGCPACTTTRTRSTSTPATRDRRAGELPRLFQGADQDDPFSAKIQAEYDKQFPGQRSCSPPAALPPACIAASSCGRPR